MLYHPTRPSAPRRRLAVAPYSALRNLIARLLAWEYARTEMVRLIALDDRILADMGIKRSQIRALFRTRKVVPEEERH